MGAQQSDCPNSDKNPTNVLAMKESNLQIVDDAAKLNPSAESESATELLPLSAVANPAAAAVAPITPAEGTNESAAASAQKPIEEPGRASDQSELAYQGAQGEDASQETANLTANPQKPQCIDAPSTEVNSATQPTTGTATDQAESTNSVPRNPHDGFNHQQTEVSEGGAVSNERLLHVKALREDGSLDIYVYHRGREGMEPRDEATGELLCDVPQTDSNYKLDEPKLSLQVIVSFPLVDEASSDMPWFEDTIHWDLGNPDTPTAMAFAARTAEEFGLSFGQTIDLATSIQNQIDRHVAENCSYAVPVAMTDGAETQRTNFPPHEVYYLYGAVCESATPGTKVKGVNIVPRSKSKSSNRASSGSSSRRNPGAIATSSRPAAPPLPTYFDEPVDDKFLEETKKRMVQYSQDNVATKCTQVGCQPGKLTIKINHVCHICHKRHNLVGQFCCGYNAHSYCAMHLQVRLPGKFDGPAFSYYIFLICPFRSLVRSPVLAYP
jgi:hypothetical protein